MQRRGNIAKAAQKYKEEKKTGEILSKELQNLQEKYKMSESTQDTLIETADAAYKHYLERYEDSIKIVDPGVIPIGQNVLLTCALFAPDDVGQFLVKRNFDLNAFNQVMNEIDPSQTVIATGKSCQEVKKGDKVVIDVDSFIRIKNPNSVKSEEVNDLEKHLVYIDKRAYLLIHERQLRYIESRLEYKEL